MSSRLVGYALGFGFTRLSIMKDKLRIMIVDDDATTLEVTGALLEEQGHEVIKRQNALGTTLAIIQDRPDVVLLDIRMPGLSGDKLVELVSPKKDMPKPIIILHSSSKRAELESLARRCGAAGSIEKTGDAAEFIRRFEQALGAPHSTADAKPSRRR
jgi:DNA-binding NtrC family response regulator